LTAGGEEQLTLSTRVGRTHERRRYSVVHGAIRRQPDAGTPRVPHAPLALPVAAVLATLLALPAQASDYPTQPDEMDKLCQEIGKEADASPRRRACSGTRETARAPTASVAASRTPAGSMRGPRSSGGRRSRRSSRREGRRRSRRRSRHASRSPPASSALPRIPGPARRRSRTSSTTSRRHPSTRVGLGRGDDLETEGARTPVALPPGGRRGYHGSSWLPRSPSTGDASRSSASAIT
jgi:hypothetical protein